MTAAGCIRLPLRRYPGMNPFVLDWLAGGNATQFLPREAPAAPRNPPPGELVTALAASNKQWGITADLSSWAAGKTKTLIAGQQVGFAGGPLYTFAKAASLVKMKRDLAKEGVDATAFFWLATEDHDYDEVSTLALPSQGKTQQDLITLRAPHVFEQKHVVGPLPIPEPLIADFLALTGLPRPKWLREGITFRDSFAELLADVFGNELVLVDALLPELRMAGAPLFEQLFAREPEIQQAIATRSRELSNAGFKPQIEPRDGHEYTLFFEIHDDGARAPLATGVTIDDPTRVSTSALTRPLLQDFVFAPDVFLGGPAEVAYYAQIAPLHDLLGIRRPRVALRGHALVAPKRVVRYFERFELDPANVFTNPDELLAEREPEGVARVQALADEGKAELLKRIEQIGELALPADHALSRAINRSIGHIEYHFGKLAERAMRGLVRKDRERYAAARELVAMFFPDRHVQDRVAAWVPYWCELDRWFADRVIEEIEPDAPSFALVGL